MLSSRRYSVEVRERAVRLYFDHRGEFSSDWAAMRSIGEQLGIAAETLRTWVRRAEIDQCQRPGVTTDERERLGVLERENRERGQTTDGLGLSERGQTPIGQRVRKQTPSGLGLSERGQTPIGHLHGGKWVTRTMLADVRLGSGWFLGVVAPRCFWGWCDGSFGSVVSAGVSCGVLGGRRVGVFDG